MVATLDDDIFKAQKKKIAMSYRKAEDTDIYSQAGNYWYEITNSGSPSDKSGSFFISYLNSISSNRVFWYFRPENARRSQQNYSRRHTRIY
jgi:hypothetical protein